MYEIFTKHRYNWIKIWQIENITWLQTNENDIVHVNLQYTYQNFIKHIMHKTQNLQFI